MQRSEILSSVTDYITKAASRLDRRRYSQESAYVDAFMGRLDGEINFGRNNGVIILTPTIVADRGRGAAESKFGADFSLVFKSKNTSSFINKAILGQAKNGYLEKLSNAELSRLDKQCEKMAESTKHFIIFEAPTKDGAIPTIRLGNQDTKNWNDKRFSFEEYLVDQVISCQHGDRAESFIDAVADSKLSKLEIIMKNLTYEADKNI
jgi:hypothetical protein